jgi:transposase
MERMRALALRLFHEGKSVGEIAKTFRVHGVTIYRLAATEALLKA